VLAGERQPGQMDGVLADLGPMPDPQDADECALWVGGLINPTSALGVAREVRPYMLQASDTNVRVELAVRALERTRCPDHTRTTRTRGILFVRTLAPLARATRRR
jgi:hypothetical protein